ncbi:UNVERIFIED_CONTAM: hypothetical protein Sradi_2063500 [Sesamum radiatum]|uniref:Uncharacterized protein n=1 Tax=Sesamum radiatum TaxID=300843 RepID=A0AAW2TIV4_SESRA
MDPFNKVESYIDNVKLYLNPKGMQEAMHSNFLTSELIKVVHSKATHSESNAEEFSKLTISEVPTNKNHKSKKPPYSPIFPYVDQSDRKSTQSSSQDHAPSTMKFNDSQSAKAELIELVISLHRLVSNELLLLKNQVEVIPGAFSSKAYHLLAKSGYDFFAPSRLGKLNPELTGEKIYGLTEAQHKLRRQGLRVDQPRAGLGFIPNEPIRMHMKKKINCVPTQYIAMEKCKNAESGRPNDNQVFKIKQLGTLVPRNSIFELGETRKTSSSSRGHRYQVSVSNYFGDGYALQLNKRSRMKKHTSQKRKRAKVKHTMCHGPRGVRRHPCSFLQTSQSR